MLLSKYFPFQAPYGKSLVSPSTALLSFWDLNKDTIQVARKTLPGIMTSRLPFLVQPHY